MSYYYEELIKNSPKINLKPTFEFLKNLAVEEKFVIKSNYPTIDGVLLMAKMIDNGNLEFKANGFNLEKDMVKYQTKGYGYHDFFTINSKEHFVNIPKGIKSMTITFSSEEKIKGEISYFSNFIESELDEKSHFFRYMTPIDYFPNFMINDFFASKIYNDGESIIPKLVMFNLNETGFRVFQYSTESDKNYLFIDCLTPVKKHVFERYIDRILYSIGFITGSLYRDRFKIFAYEDDFVNVKHFESKEIEKSIISSIAIVHPIFFSDYFGRKSRIEYLDIGIFEKLINLSIVDLNFYRSIQLICESSLLPGLLRASILSVGLETFKNVILASVGKQLPPMKKRSFKEFKNNVDKLISEVDVNDFNDRSGFLKRIDNLNQPTNFDTFLKMFEILDLKLNKFYEDILKTRNDFLHGKIPGNVRNGVNDLDYVSLKLRILLSISILKYCGYKGYVLNYSELKAFKIGVIDKEIEGLFFRI